MTVIFQTGYSKPAADQPLTHARIAHARNWMSGGVVSVSSTAAGYFKDAPKNTLTYEFWKPDVLQGVWRYDHDSAVECDYCVIGAHNMGTNGNSLQVQYDNGSGWTGVIAATAIADDTPIYVMFSPQTRQNWRIVVTNGTAPEIGVIKFGKALQMQRPIYGGHSPMPLARQAVLRSNVSEIGEVLGRTKQRVNLATSFGWQNLKADWVRSNWPDLQRAIEDEAFFVAWRPADFGEVAFGISDTTPIPVNSGGASLMAATLNMRGYSHD